MLEIENPEWDQFEMLLALTFTQTTFLLDYLEKSQELVTFSPRFYQIVSYLLLCLIF